MTYYVSSGTLNLTKPKPKPVDAFRVFVLGLYCIVVIHVVVCYRYGELKMNILCTCICALPTVIVPLY